MSKEIVSFAKKNSDNVDGELSQAVSSYLANAFHNNNFNISKHINKF